jgi:hypothetical protein
MSALDEFLNDDEEWLDGTDTHELGEKYYHGVKEAAAEYKQLRADLAAAVRLLRHPPIYGSDKYIARWMVDAGKLISRIESGKGATDDER